MKTRENYGTSVTREELRLHYQMRFLTFEEFEELFISFHKKEQFGNCDGFMEQKKESLPLSLKIAVIFTFVNFIACVLVVIYQFIK